MDTLALVNEKLFLGQEFLTWLWHASEELGHLDLPGGRQVEVLLGGHLVLGPLQGQEGTRVTVKGREASLAEARRALQRGKLVESLRLGLILDGEEYWLSLDAAHLGIKGLRLPLVAPAQGGEGLEGLALERLALIESAVRAVEELFGLYLAQRLECKGLPQDMRAWAAGEEVKA
ncbi:MAG: hypothetical protein HY794_13445 [Desulfarculus sp.]|nr:hypothetical protein [Desulfarculus sp.]